MQKKWFYRKCLVTMGVVAWLILVLSACGTAGAPQDAGQGQAPAEAPNTGDTESTSSDDAAKREDQTGQVKEGDQNNPLENEAFRVTQPQASDVIGMSLKVAGEARVYEGNFHYTIEDGHNILAEGTGKTEKGAPEWSPFELQIQLEQPPSSPHGMLILYEKSAKDGTPVNQLNVPLTFDEKIVKPMSAQ